MKTLSDNVLRELNKNALIKTIKELYAMRDEAIKYIEEIQNFPHTNENQHRDCKKLKDILQGNKEEE